MNTKIFFCEMLRHIKPDVIYDIGSRDGKEAILFKKIIRSAEVTAFEVNPTLVQRIKILPEFKNGNVLLMNCAVSDKDGVSDFFISDADYDADYDMDWRVGTSSLREKTAHGSKRRISVRTYTLDTLLSNKKGKSIVLWIDIEGCSCEALSGMNEISGQVKMIHAEIETKEFWKGQRLFDDILSLMREKGFYLAIKKIYKHGQGNAIFLKNEITSGGLIWFRAYAKGLLSRINHSISKRLNP